jgi:integrase
MTEDVIILVDRYLAERQRLGFELRHSSYCLRSLARHVQRSNHLGPLTLEVMTQWAAQGRSSMPASLHMARRMRHLRPFARWLLQFEPNTEVPDETVCGHRPVRGTPHIYSEQEVEELMAAARRLGPPTSIRGVLYETLFGLLASTGLRISEALALRLADVDLQQGVLTIRRTKFGKSRAVPLHPSTTHALCRYRASRDLTGAASGEEEHLFIGLRADVLGTPLAGHQARLVFAGLRRELGWVNRGTHHAPRIHDLRHTFVVRRVLLWQQQGVDVDQAMLSLSTYLGHAGVADTYWYLQAVPDLMAVAAQRFDACMPEMCDA